MVGEFLSYGGFTYGYEGVNCIKLSQPTLYLEDGLTLDKLNIISTWKIQNYLGQVGLALGSTRRYPLHIYEGTSRPIDEFVLRKSKT